MASEVKICNVGLAFLGVPSIIALSDNSKAARHCSLLFDDKRDELIRAHDWTFAIRRTNLSPLSASPGFKWTYQFQKPSDCLRLFIPTLPLSDCKYLFLDAFRSSDLLEFTAS